MNRKQPLQSFERPTVGQLRAWIEDPLWNCGNQVLYDFCRSHPEHTDASVIVAKVWLIGRSYAAAIERGRSDADKISGDLFYKIVVARKTKASRIDKWFTTLRKDKKNDRLLSLQVHGRLTALFKRISGSEKRSLASKYLHFHFPKRFFIFDSRAKEAIEELTEPVPIPSELSHLQREVYVKFWLRCEKLQREVETRIGRPLTLRELDKVLVAFCDKRRAEHHKRADKTRAI